MSTNIGFFEMTVLYCIAYWYILLAPVIPLWKNSSCYSLLEDCAAAMPVCKLAQRVKSWEPGLSAGIAVIKVK